MKLNEKCPGSSFRLLRSYETHVLFSPEELQGNHLKPCDRFDNSCREINVLTTLVSLLVLSVFFHIFAPPQWYYRIFTLWECNTLNNKRMQFCFLLYQIFTHDSQCNLDCSCDLKQCKHSKTETKVQIWGIRMLKFKGEGWLEEEGRWQGTFCYMYNHVLINHEQCDCSLCIISLISNVKVNQLKEFSSTELFYVVLIRIVLAVLQSTRRIIMELAFACKPFGGEFSFVPWKTFLNYPEKIN